MASLDLDFANLKVTDWNHELLNACIYNIPTHARTAIHQGATKLNTALVQACKHGHLQMVKLLVDDYGARDVHDNGWWEAAIRKHKDILAYLLAKK